MNKKQSKPDSIETRGSTMFTEITWDNGRLRVCLTNGTKYTFRQVPESVWKHFKKASSYGHYFNNYIKGVYQYERLA